VGYKKLMRKGISEMLAIVLGVVITIAIGVALFGLLPNYITTMSQQQRIAVTQLSASKLNSTTCIVAFTVKNLGSKDIANISLAIAVNGNWIAPDRIKPIALESAVKQSGDGVSISVALAPGQEVGVAVQVEAGSLLQIGAQVTVVVKAVYIDGTTATASSTTHVM